ncbi:MAG: modulator protein [Rhodospirillaceae bacterium]|nr:modulator protein [Rhodospirillaceae bacterium]
MDKDQQIDLLQGLIERARRAGADSADGVFIESRSMSVAQRLGKPEAVERSEEQDVGFRVFVGKRQSVVSTTDTKAGNLVELVDRVIAMARVAPEDQYAGLAEPGEIAQSIPEFDMFDSTEPPAERLIERAATAEEAALGVKGVTNSEGGEAGWSASRVTLTASNGFTGSYQRSSHSVSAVVLAGEGQGMERDYDYSATVYESDLEDAAVIGKSAGQRAVRRLNPRRPRSATVPVVYDPRVSRSLIGHLAGGLNGSSIARGTSFLKDAMHSAIFSQGIEILDDPHRARGLRTKPFDAEGIATMRRAIIDDGHVRSWFLDLATSRQLGQATTGHATRSPGGVPGPSPTNLFLSPGEASPSELMADIQSGLYVTELMGMSVDMVTGDYSRGAGGFWIQNGEITYPVSDVTIAGNLKDMFAALTPANDLVLRYGTDAPTVRVDGMTVAGPGN